MQASLANPFERKSLLHAGFTFLTNSLRAVDHFQAYDAYIAPRKETHKMKRIVVILAATLSMFILTTAFAQEGEHHMMMRHPGPGADDIATALNLSTDQKVQWDSIHQQLEASVKPLFDQNRAAEQTLNSLVDSSNPDPTAVGKAYLALRAIGKQIKTAHESTHAKLSAILTPDQKAKFDAMHANMEREHGPMMMKMEMHHPGDARE
jgi:Spy/CpxP family protein refolding chaperone